MGGTHGLMASRGVQIALLLIIAILPPLLLVSAALRPDMAIIAFFGLLVGLLVALMAGRTLALTAALLITLLGPVAVVAGMVPTAGAALMALSCIGVGITAGWGVHKGMSMILLGLSYLLVDPPTVGVTTAQRLDSDYIAAVLLALAIGAFWPAIIVAYLRRGTTLPKPPRNTRADTIQYTAVITATCAVATWVVLTWAPQSNASWLLMTLIVVVQVGPQATLSKTLQRVSGTVLGGALAAGLVALMPAGPALAVIGLVAMTLAIFTATGPRYWLYSFFLTPAIVLLSGADDAAAVDSARVGYTVLGGAMALAAILISGWIRDMLSERPATT